jgi:hypothetical protein
MPKEYRLSEISGSNGCEYEVNPLEPSGNCMYHPL